ncbi:HYR domain-containing protein [Flavobacterium sp. N502536]|uniref:HYR domain-containing protein n=1 Tax=Flavobacterium sp. N502536 TaxID=2986837 RepID=UPI0022216A0B|nr:HYR domain-containing protein [Flavobacterium sp. N502536]
MQNTSFKKLDFLNLLYKEYRGYSFLLRIALLVLPYIAHSQCTVNTVNPGFELPVGGGIVNQSQVPGWKTTAPDGSIEIWARVNAENFLPFEGNQFVELNAYVAAGLYQDFDTREATTFNYSFAHRGRKGTDVMVLKAGPPGGPYTEVTRAATGNTAWKAYTGTYQIPVYQSTTRFIFEAVSTSTGNVAMGNLLDAINFTATLGTPPVTGAGSAACEGNSVTLTASAKPGSTVNWYNSSGILLYTGLSYTTPALFSNTKYQIEQVSSSGCKSGLSDINVTVTPRPAITLSGAAKACLTTTLTAVTNAASPKFVWYKDDAIINGQVSSTLVVTANGNYKVRAINGVTSCDQTSDVTTVEVADTTSPVITCPANITQTAEAGKCGANISITNPTATDNCSTAFTFTGVRSDALALNAAYPTGITTIFWTATDASGNVSAACTQTITIIDSEKPIINCLANITQVTDPGTCNASVTITNPTATDNCSTAFTFTGVRSDALPLTAAYPTGVTTITWTATDASGNVSTACAQTITITDTVKPVLKCPANLIQTTDTGKCSASVTITNPTATDNCSTVFTFTGVRSDALALNAAYPTGVTTITWTATDASGNVSTPCTQTITITDGEKPIISCPVSITQTTDAGKCTASVTITNPTATDNCSTAFTFTGVRSDALPLTAAYPIGSSTIRWTATDASGNVSTACTQTITITDTEKPVITCPANLTQTTGAGACGANLTITNPTATDNCSTAFTFAGVRSDALALTAAYPTGITTITWTVTDASGNVSTPCTQTITITDKEKPIIIIPSNIEQTADAGKCGAKVTIVNPTATDNCSTAFTFTGVRSDALALTDVYPIGTTTISWTATDASGNISSSCVQTIKITDTEKPVITCPANITQTVDAATCSANLTITNPTATDNCSTAFTFTAVRSDALALTAAYPIGTTTISWTAIDNNGNVATCEQQVTVLGSIKATNDSGAPVNSTVGGMVVNVLDNDLLNCTTATAAKVKIALAGTLPAGINFDTATGKVSVNAHTPAGTYTFDYTICDLLNPTNCSTSTVTIEIEASKIETPVQTPSFTIGATGGTTPSIVSGNTLNGQPVVIGTKPGEVTLTGTKVPAGFTLNPDGTVTVPPNTPGGSYTVEYQLCEVINPANCNTSTVTIEVEASKIETPVQMPSFTIGATGGTTPSIVSGNTINGQPVVIGTKPGEVTLTATQVPPGFTLNPDGTVTVPPNTPGGSYTVEYQLCEVSNPANCSTGSVKIEIEASKIETPVQTPSFTIGATGGTTPSIVSDVKINGQPVVIGTKPGEVTLSGTKVPAGFTLNPDGTVTVPPNTAGGSYTVEYQMCEVSNPANCSTGSVTIEIKGPTNNCEIKVSNAFSPNGDSLNNRFYIQGLECYPDNTVEIYNRWGKLIYKCERYNNEDRVFTGGNGEVAGTYYYVLKYRDSNAQTHEKAGYVFISK